MADASGSQLRAEGVNIQPANSHQLTADKGAQQFFTWRTEAVFPLCQFSARRRSILKCWARLSLRKARNPGSSGVVAAINSGGMIFSSKSA